MSVVSGLTPSPGRHLALYIPRPAHSRRCVSRRPISISIASCWSSAAMPLAVAHFDSTTRLLPISDIELTVRLSRPRRSLPLCGNSLSIPRPLPAAPEIPFFNFAYVKIGDMARPWQEVVADKIAIRQTLIQAHGEPDRPTHNEDITAIDHTHEIIQKLGAGAFTAADVIRAYIKQSVNVFHLVNEILNLTFPESLSSTEEGQSGI